MRESVKRRPVLLTRNFGTARDVSEEVCGEFVLRSRRIADGDCDVLPSARKTRRFR
jgi:hypothetical protein